MGDLKAMLFSVVARTAEPSGRRSQFLLEGAEETPSRGLRTSGGRRAPCKQTLPDRKRKWRSCYFLSLDHGRKRRRVGETMGQTRVSRLPLQPKHQGWG